MQHWIWSQNLRIQWADTASSRRAHNRTNRVRGLFLGVSDGVKTSAASRVETPHPGYVEPWCEGVFGRDGGAGGLWGRRRRPRRVSRCSFDLADIAHFGAGDHHPQHDPRHHGDPDQRADADHDRPERRACGCACGQQLGDLLRAHRGEPEPVADGPVLAARDDLAGGVVAQLPGPEGRPGVVSLLPAGGEARIVLAPEGNSLVAWRTSRWWGTTRPWSARSHRGWQPQSERQELVTIDLVDGDRREVAVVGGYEAGGGPVSAEPNGFVLNKWSGGTGSSSSTMRERSGRRRSTRTRSAWTMSPVLAGGGFRRRTPGSPTW